MSLSRQFRINSPIQKPVRDGGKPEIVRELKEDLAQIKAAVKEPGKPKLKHPVRTKYSTHITLRIDNDVYDRLVTDPEWRGLVNGVLRSFLDHRDNSASRGAAPARLESK